MIRIDAIWNATELIDMRAGTSLEQQDLDPLKSRKPQQHPIELH